MLRVRRGGVGRTKAYAVTAFSRVRVRASPQNQSALKGQAIKRGGGYTCGSIQQHLVNCVKHVQRIVVWTHIGSTRNDVYIDLKYGRHYHTRTQNRAYCEVERGR